MWVIPSFWIESWSFDLMHTYGLSQFLFGANEVSMLTSGLNMIVLLAITQFATATALSYGTADTSRYAHPDWIHSAG